MNEKKDVRNVTTVIIGAAILLFLIFIIIPPSQSAMVIYLFGLEVSFLIYNTGNLQSALVGISFSGAKVVKSFIYGGLFGLIFLLATAIIPGLSIGIPLLPNAISDQVKLFIIVFVAPIIETIIFQGAIFGYFRKLTNPTTAIIIQATLFAIAHVAAYVTGFYAYPSFVEGLSAVAANISSFVAAFLFAVLAGWFVYKDGIRNLLFVMFFHMALNSVIYFQAFSIVIGG